MGFGYKPQKVKDQLRIFIAYLVYNIKDNESKRNGALALIKREGAQKKTTNIANLIEKYVKHDNSYNALRIIEASARYIFDNADLYKKSKPDAEGQHHIDLLHALQHKLKQKSLIDALSELNSAAGPSSAKVVIPDEINRFIYDTVPGAAIKAEALNAIAPQARLTDDFIAKVIKESPSLQVPMGTSSSPQSKEAEFPAPAQQPLQPGMGYPGGAPQQMYPPQGQMYPPQGQMYPPPQQGFYPPPDQLYPPPQGQMYPPPQQQGYAQAPYYAPQQPLYQPPPQMSQHPGMPQQGIEPINPYQNI